MVRNKKKKYFFFVCVFVYVFVVVFTQNCICVKLLSLQYIYIFFLLSDAFDVLDAKHSGNLFATYSQSKNTSYSFTHETSFGKYRFIAVDACPNPGPRRPFNFFGILDNQDLNELETRLAKPEDYNHTSM